MKINITLKKIDQENQKMCFFINCIWTKEFEFDFLLLKSEEMIFKVFFHINRVACFVNISCAAFRENDYMCVPKGTMN